MSVLVQSFGCGHHDLTFSSTTLLTNLIIDHFGYCSAADVEGCRLLWLEKLMPLLLLSSVIDLYLFLFYSDRVVSKLDLTFRHLRHVIYIRIM